MTFFSGHQGLPQASKLAVFDDPEACEPGLPMTTSDHASPIEPPTPGQGAAQECAAIAADLERLKALINDASGRLMDSFTVVGAALPHLAQAPEEQARVNGAVAAAVTALQFQDIATQLTAHAQRRLDALQELMKTISADVAVSLLAVNTHPVGQAEMSAGSVDLF